MMIHNDRQWTRLIDGELSFAEQRALLASLDESPEEWKRLALGLLEADAFRRELRTCVPVAAAIVSPLHARQRAPRRLVQSLAAVAASLVCLGLGMAMERLRVGAADGIDQSSAVTSTFAPDEATTQKTLKLVFADWPADGQSVDVPVVEAADVDAAELLQRSAIPDAVRKQLESQGYVIHEQRKYVPVSLANGRQGIAPVSDVVVQYQPVAFQ